MLKHVDSDSNHCCCRSPSRSCIWCDKRSIAKAQEKAKQEAFRSVLSDAETFESDTEFDADAASALLKENGYTSDDISEVAEGKDSSGETVGYVVNVTSHEGYGGDIDISVGIRKMEQ